MKRKLFTFLLVTAVCLPFFCSSTSAAERHSISIAERDSISVNGHASTEAAPDMATLYGELEKRGTTAEAARENLAKDIAAFKRLLLLQMIPEQDIQIIHYSLQPEYLSEKNKQKPTGYLACADYKIKIKDLEKLSTVIDKAINGNLFIRRVEFGLNNRAPFENSLLNEAVANARTKAEVVARAGGRTLGSLIRANLGTVTSSSRTMDRSLMMAKAADMTAAETTPATELSPGTITVEANVNLEFALE